MDAAIKEQEQNDIKEKTLAQKIREFDDRVGADLDRGGYKAFSRVDHERLRGYLNEAGYEMIRSDKVSPSAEYGLSEKNVYARCLEGEVELFVERNVYDWSDGFSYGTLSTAVRLEQFTKDYQRVMKRSPGYAAGVAGVSGFAMAGSTLMLEGFPGAVLLFFPSIIGTYMLMDSSLRNERKAKQELRFRFHRTNRLAILQAFHVPEKKDAPAIIPLEEE